MRPFYCVECIVYLALLVGHQINVRAPDTIVDDGQDQGLAIGSQLEVLRHVIADPVLGGGQAIGPFLQGFAKPVSDLSRGAPVEEIVGAVTMAGVCVHG